MVDELKILVAILSSNMTHIQCPMGTRIRSATRYFCPYPTWPILVFRIVRYQVTQNIRSYPIFWVNSKSRTLPMFRVFPAWLGNFRYNTTTVLWLPAPLDNTLNKCRKNLSLWLTTSDALICFFYFWNAKQPPKGHLKYGGVPSVWGGEGGSEVKLFLRGPVRKYVPNACSSELLVWSEVIWGRFAVILVILECRITVWYKTFCQICKCVLASRALHVLQNV